MKKRAKKAINFALGAARTKTLKETFITSFGTISTGVLGLIFYILLARHLGPAGFGAFSVATATIAIVASLSDFGTNTGIVRFAGKYFTSDENKALRFLKLALKVKVVAWALVLSFGWILMPFIAGTILSKPELIFPLRLALIGVGGSLLLSFSTYSLQSMQRFWVWSGLNFSMNALRLLMLLALIYLSSISVFTGLLAYIVFPFLGFLIGLLILPNFWKAKKENELMQEFFSYNKWVAAFSATAALSSRLDTYITTRFLTLSEVGVYSVATNLSSIVPDIVFAMAVVVAPKLAGFDAEEKAKEYLKKLQTLVVGLAVLGLVVGIPLSYFVIPTLYGTEYLASIAPFTILLIAQALFLISIPAHTSIFYYFSNPKLFFFITVGHLLLIGIVGWILIGSYGYMGAAATVLIGNVYNFIIPAAWVVRKFQSANTDDGSPNTTH